MVPWPIKQLLVRQTWDNPEWDPVKHKKDRQKSQAKLHPLTFHPDLVD